ncbi:MAG: B12-binding domain-containing radical SAM protein [Bacteroidetes bacterium]|nr:B12-binding domain-containing radical SAM protein [Bacteroidota bacterium]
MSVLLTTLNAKYIHSNLAIRLLYQLNKHHAGLAWKEFTIKEPKDEIAQYCKDFDVVAFSVYIWNFTQTLEVCRKIKALNPKVKIMLGGPEVSYEYEPVIMLDEVDYIVIGEGEIPFARFLENDQQTAIIPGIVSKKDGQLIYIPSLEDFELSALADINPYIDDNVTDLKNKVLYIETSRGCPYKCSFCLASLDNKVRYLSMPRIKANLLYLMQHGKVIKFLDRTFNVKKDFTLEIFQFILDHHQPGNIFQFEITADILHPDIIKYVNEVVPKGLFRFEIGIQTVNQKANLEVSSKQNFYKTKGVIEQVRDKIEMHLDLIVGLPLDYWEDVKYSIEEVFKIFPPELQLGFLKFLKGTPVRDTYQQHHYVFDPNPPYQIIESDYLSKDALYQITQLEFALEAYWNKKRMVNSLKYITLHYSIFDFLLGLGKYFAEKSDYHKHTHEEIYQIAFEYLERHYAHDKILKQLFAIDYYLQHKIKPKMLFIEEVERQERNQLIESMKLNHHKYRFGILPLILILSIFNNIKLSKKASNPW